LEPFFTILTASLNSGSTIRKNLLSVSNQTHESVEHIVIDGRSSDQTIDILREFERSYNLRWISEPDSGIANALNKGLRLAKGTYILVLQADDQLMDTEVLETLYPILKDELYDIHSFPVIRDKAPDRKIPCNPIKIPWWHHFKTIFLHQGAFVHRRTYELIGDFREELAIAFDYDFFYRALKARSKVKFYRYPIAIMGGEGISSNEDFLLIRLREESSVQIMNETNRFWRAIQSLFRTIYVPYKTRLVPYWRTCFRKSSDV
jgi:glycosyltransferase involved in cell wall biosynthesis